MIGAAVMKAYADFTLDGIIDTINVAPGIYVEDVIIRTPLSLVGAGRGQSIINAIGLSNGIYIDGLENPGLSKVVVTGFTIGNANFEGILVTNASFVTIWDNQVINNDRNLNISALNVPASRLSRRTKTLIAVKESISLALITRRWSITFQRKTPAGFCSAMKLARRTTT